MNGYRLWPALSLALALAGVAHGAPADLDAARAAAGGAAWAKIGSLSATGEMREAGMARSWRQVVDLRSPRLDEVEDAGVVKTRKVWIGPDCWRQDFSGGVHRLDSQFGRQTALTDEWLARGGYLRAGADGAQIVAGETHTEGDRSFTTATATPKGGQPVELWFDAKTHLLARSVRRLNLETETVGYDDYRPVAGVMLPFRLTIDDGDPDSVATIAIDAYQANAATRADFTPPTTPPDWSVAGGKTTVPVRYDGEVVVEAKINGQGPFGFILDTGGHDILTPAAATAIGLTPQGGGRSGGAGEGTVSEQYARVDRLEIGGMTMRDQPFTIIPMSYDTVEQGPRPPLAGILGLELFERFAMRLDYQRQELTLQPLASYAHTGKGRAVGLHFNDDEPLLTASMDGHAGDFGIDTGNSGSLIVQGVWADREGLTGALKHGYEGVGFGMGGVTHNWASRVDLDLAGKHLSRVIGRYEKDKAGAFASIVEAGNIGDEVLANYTLTFDYQRGQLWFEPVDGYRMPDFGRTGLALSKTGPDAFKVVMVAAASPAADAGLKAGDDVTAVDGVAASQLSGWDLRRIWRRPAGAKVRVDFNRGGAAQTATIVPRDLLP